MKLTVQFVVWCVLCATSGVAGADYFNGHDLVQHMHSADPHDVAMFRGYIAGVQDVYNGETFCVPGHVRLSQAASVVATYLTANPPLRRLPAKQLVLQALVDRFPCTKE
jgi:hypothetical protein